MKNEKDFFDGTTEEEREAAAPLLMELGAIIDVADGNGDILGVLDPESLQMAQELATTPEGRSTVNFMKVILGVDKPSQGPSM